MSVSVERRSAAARANREHKEALLIAYNNQCAKCQSTENLQVDHIIPVSLDGSDDISNMQILCGLCNRRKSGKKNPGYARAVKLNAGKKRILLYFSPDIVTKLDKWAAKRGQTFKYAAQQILENYAKKAA